MSSYWPSDFYKCYCNQGGTGYTVKHGIVTAFDERQLFLKSSYNNVTSEDTKEIPEPKAGASTLTEPAERPFFQSEIERKFGTRTECTSDESENGTEIIAKAELIKNGTNDAIDFMEDDEDTSVENSLFSNDLLLRTIFANLNVKDLKSCREVNRLWNLEATMILLKRDSLTAIQISNDIVTLHNGTLYKRRIDLEDFRDIIANSKLFPITSFSLRDVPLSQDIIDFFRDYGQLVKSLCVEPKDGYSNRSGAATADEILLLAAMHLPNLRTLELLRNDGRLETTSPVIIMAIDYCPGMKNLKTLKITPTISPDVVARILKKATSLENIYSYFYEHTVLSLKYLVNLENFIPRLKNMNFFFKEDTVEIYEQILKQNPRFSDIGIISFNTADPVDVPEVGRFLTKLFQECSESLTEILDWRYIKEIRGFRLPVFSNVKILGIKLECLVLWVNLAQAFPNLVTVRIECMVESEIEEISPESLVPFLSVRNVQVFEGPLYVPGSWIKIICALFPNAISAKFCVQLMDSAYEYIWKLSKLQNLHLVIGTKAKFFALDSAFTGFSVDTVQNLHMKNKAEWNLSGGEVESLRIKPSIIDLKDLRRLHLRLLDTFLEEPIDENRRSGNETFGNNGEVIFDTGDGNALLQVEGEVILSYISKRFGFDMCPRLNSNVSLGFTYYTLFHKEDYSDTDDE